MGIAKKFLNNNNNNNNNINNNNGNDNSNFKSQFILAEHECSTNWGDCKANKSNQISNEINHIYQTNLN